MSSWLHVCYYNVYLLQTAGRHTAWAMCSWLLLQRVLIANCRPTHCLGYVQLVAITTCTYRKLQADTLLGLCAAGGGDLVLPVLKQKFLHCDLCCTLQIITLLGLEEVLCCLPLCYFAPLFIPKRKPTHCLDWKKYCAACLVFFKFAPFSFQIADQHTDWAGKGLVLPV